jgi:hypothetical protein
VRSSTRPGPTAPGAGQGGAAREPISRALPRYWIAALTAVRSLMPGFLGDSTMRAPSFGLSTTPVMDVKSELRLQLERDLLALVYRDPR